MIHHEYAITPSQQATNGAPSIFIEGCRQRFGLSIPRNAPEAPVHAAMSFAETNQQVPLGEIQAMLAR